ncbi:LysR family transcriptional regulator [Marinomonas sp. A79]|uniref:LysR family transcriptional regulator n=1 Tax=Marinomonas vulgaris TaxID=2823372 RepID=A0ABS5H7R2_9GAMM|nr:LysR family transcriptional regulator [Marinomonas vulgaris]MBR7887482.1 LysR family transcriptional regulator [Marinomonas vulgaris]
MFPDLKITQLRHFVWVTELKGFHAAAEKAHRTQPAISLSIRDLETKLGESLFEKRNVKTAKAELTPFGLYFLPKAKELIKHHDRVAEDMRLLSEHKAGHLRIASVPSIASRVLPELLEEFITHTPDLHVSFFDDNSEAVLKMVETQKVDFGIAHLFHQEEHSDKDFIPIWQDQIGVVCPIDHPLAQKSSLCWEELTSHRLINNGTSRLLEDSDASALLGLSQFYVSNMISLIAMIEAGLGITTLPWYAFPQDSTTLRFIPLAEPQVVRRLGIVLLKNKSLTPPAQAFLDFTIEKMGTL